MEECLAVLKQAEIPFRIETTAPIFEISSIGSGGVNNEAIVLVPSDQLSHARSVMLEDARETIKITPPTADDYLATLDTPTLEQMLKEPEGWSFHDLAAAEFLLGQRGGSITQITFPDPTAPPKNYAPVRANWLVISFAVLVTGGVYGMIVAWSLIHSRQHGSDSPYHYDDFSRAFGYLIFALTIVAWGLCISLMWETIIHPQGMDRVFGGRLFQG